MKRTVFEVGLVVAVIIFGLEAVHYRNAVLDCNVDRKRAWKTVVELRSTSNFNAVEKPPPSSDGGR